MSCLHSFSRLIGRIISNLLKSVSYNLGCLAPSSSGFVLLGTKVSEATASSCQLMRMLDNHRLLGAAIL